MNRDALDLWCERGILGLVLGILVFGPLAFGAVPVPAFLVVQGLTLGVMALWVLRLWLNPRPLLLFPPICWAVLAFVAYAIYRYFTADIEYIARQEMIRILVYAFLFLAIINNLHRQDYTHAISLVLIFLAMAIAGYAVYQLMTNSDRVWTYFKPYTHRGSGTYISPNHLAGFLGLVLPLALAYTFAGRLKPVTRVLVGYAALVIIAGIAATVSRGGWVATSLALIIFFVLLLLQRAYRLPALVALILMLIAGAILMPKVEAFQSRVRQIVTVQGKLNSDMRFVLWNSALQIWKTDVWRGAGPAHFDARFSAYRPESVQVTPDWAHNDYLNTLAEYGLIGTLLVAAAWLLLGAGLWRTWRTVRRSDNHLGPTKDSNRFAFVLGASIGLAAILFHSVFDFNLHIPANAILTITLMAMLSGHLRFATDRWWFRASAAVKVLASAMLVAGLAFLAFQGQRHVREYASLRQADRMPNFSLAQIGLLKQAFVEEPLNPQTAFRIGEALRYRSQEGGSAYVDAAGVDYRQIAEEALEWYGRSLRLNPWNARACCGYGWCLDWLDRSAEASSYFARAERMDPNNYFVMNSIGRHYIECKQYAAARPWFERSLRLEWADNPIAQSYLQIADQNLREAATNELRARLLAP